MDVVDSKRLLGPAVALIAAQCLSPSLATCAVGPQSKTSLPSEIRVAMLGRRGQTIVTVNASESGRGHVTVRVTAPEDPTHYSLTTRLDPHQWQVLQSRAAEVRRLPPSVPYVPSPPSGGEIEICVDPLGVRLDIEGTHLDRDACNADAAFEFGVQMARDVTKAIPECSILTSFDDWYVLRACLSLRGRRDDAAEVMNAGDAGQAFVWQQDDVADGVPPSHLRSLLVPNVVFKHEGNQPVLGADSVATSWLHLLEARPFVNWTSVTGVRPGWVIVSGHMSERRTTDSRAVPLVADFSQIWVRTGDGWRVAEWRVGDFAPSTHRRP